MQDDEQDFYPGLSRCSDLVRYWQETDGTWRFSVEPVDGRSLPRRGFTRKSDLLAYLEAVLPENSDPEQPDPLL